MTDTCSLCRGVGWILDQDTASHRDPDGPQTLELLPCLIPDCEHSGRPIELLNLHVGDSEFPVEVSRARNPQSPEEK